MSVEQLREPLRSIVKKIIAESGGKVSVSSAFRTRAQQSELYRRYLSGKGNLAARPGHSKHESGMAVDFGGDLRLAGQLAQKYGLAATVPGEPWHFEYQGGKFEGDTDPDFQYDLSPGQESSSNPQDVLANRLHSVLRIIGLNPTVGSPGVMMEESGSPEMDEVFAPGGGMDEPMSSGNPVITRAATGAKGQLQQYAQQQLAKYGFSPEDYPALVTLWNKESGWNPNAQNPTSTAYGIAQFLNSTWSGVGASKTSDPYRQIDAGLQYIKGRYGSPSAALQFHLRNNWY